MAGSSNGRVSRRVGEVIETSTTRLWAESDQLNELPPLGSLVRVATPSGDVIYAVVSFGQTTGVDATRRAVRRGSDDVRDEDVYRQHPELTRILRTTFEAVPVGFRRDGRIHRLLPSLPPPLHYSVEIVDDLELHDVTDDPRYLTLLAAYRGEVPPEQLIAAHVRAAYSARGDDAAWLDLAAREVATLFKSDYDLLVPLLEAIDPQRA